MDYLQLALQSPFVWGLLLGLLIAGFLWKSGFTARRHAAAEVRRVQSDLRELRGIVRDIQTRIARFEHLKAP